MTSTTLTLGLYTYAALGVITVAILAFVDAPYGRHDRAGWGPRMPNRLAWFVMEAPGVLAAVAFFVVASPTEPVRWLFLALWLLHYGYRALMFPWLLRTRGKTVPLLVPALGFGFNVFNAWLNLGWVAVMGTYGPGWLADPRFLIGAGLFLTGFVTHVRSDAILRGLRPPGDTTYRVPYGFLYRWVSCPNYLGELMQWGGWALLTWSPAGLLFALYTLANLGPRARAHHRWYRNTFPDYPSNRRALVPFVL